MFKHLNYLIGITNSGNLVIFKLIEIRPHLPIGLKLGKFPILVKIWQKSLSLSLSLNWSTAKCEKNDINSKLLISRHA